MPIIERYDNLEK